MFVSTAALMFKLAAVFNQNISNWDVSSITNFSGMFSNTESFNQDISNCVSSELTSAICSIMPMYLIQILITGMLVGTNFSNMFHHAYLFNSNISNDVSSGINLVRSRPNFDQDIRHDVGSGINFELMFDGAYAMNNLMVFAGIPAIHSLILVCPARITKSSLLDATAGETYSLNISDLLRGYTDPDGDPLSITNLWTDFGTLDESGNLKINNTDSIVVSVDASGNYTFTPPTNLQGDIDFYYTISDGKGGEIEASQSISVRTTDPIRF